MGACCCCGPPPPIPQQLQFFVQKPAGAAPGSTFAANFGGFVVPVIVPAPVAPGGEGETPTQEKGGEGEVYPAPPEGSLWIAPGYLKLPPDRKSGMPHKKLVHNGVVGRVFRGDCVVVNGHFNIVTGDMCTVNGNFNWVRGDMCAVSGSKNVVSGDVTKVEGMQNTVSGDVNKVAGAGNVVTGDVNTVTGDGNLVTGDVNHVTGAGNVVTGDVSRLVLTAPIDVPVVVAVPLVQG